MLRLLCLKGPMEAADIRMELEMTVPQVSATLRGLRQEGYVTKSKKQGHREHVWTAVRCPDSITRMKFDEEKGDMDYGSDLDT